MFAFAALLNNDWAKYYGGSTHQTVQWEYVNMSVYDDKNYYITDCIFTYVIEFGVIRFENPSSKSKILLDTSRFYNCSHFTKSGACLFVENGGECIQEKNIVRQCYSTTSGQYSHTDLIKSENSRNILSSITIELSSNTIQDEPGDSLIKLGKGKQYISSVNMSQNFAKGITTIEALNFLDNAVSSSILFNNTKNNGEQPFAYFQGLSENKLPVYVERCIIFQNKEISTHPKGSLIQAEYASIYLSHSCIMKNNISTSIKCDDKSQIILLNSYIDNGNIIGQTNVVAKDNSVKEICYPFATE